MNEKGALLHRHYIHLAITLGTTVLIVYSFGYCSYHAKSLSLECMIAITFDHAFNTVLLTLHSFM
jgi:hypothetical protein